MRPSRLLCVGSALAPRYRIGTLQAFALPAGCHIQFRYAATIVSPELHDLLEADALNGVSVTLGHVDTSPEGRQADGKCLVLPYREAKLKRSRQAGTFFVLQFELGAFAISRAPTALSSSLPSSSPHWMDGSEEPVGSWCQGVAEELVSVQTGDSLQIWEELAKQLKGRKAFSQEPYFCAIVGMFQSRSAFPMKPVAGEYRLDASSEYELRLIHYDPEAGPHTGDKPVRWLTASVAEPGLKLRSSSFLAIDSPYDLKSISIRTDDTLRSEYSSVLLSDKTDITPSNPVPSGPWLELLIAIKINGSIWKNLGLGFLLGVLLTGQQLVSMFSKPDTNPSGIAIWLTVLLGMLTGAVAVFGLKKSV